MSRVLPILFNTDMVRAILDGRKTVTRRVIKPQPKSKLCYTFAGSDCGTWGYPSKTAYESWGKEYRLPDNITKEDLGKRWNPPYHTDDVLYVRETWLDYAGRFMYKADCDKYRLELAEFTWRPSIHMPKEAARIWLKVKDVRVERLQEMNEIGTVKEGIRTDVQIRRLDDPDFIENFGGIELFKDLWNSTIKKPDIDRYGWDANPWVWVIEFERCEKP